jgi:DNA-binding PadR family transcriptional regulator
MPIKGQKNIKGVPELYNEIKKRVNIALTPSGAEMLKEVAAKEDLSVSELIERFAREQYEIMKGKVKPF